ncbi:hypothetical protein [Deinococcus soli (ex Cha et al. 2016)]|uniref:Uncharacterized protein n=2 Tax=Deinococcus soli (ex Cha et al. 2016) TaxID=1309411 RepID=A0ACC6KHA3_9DEIO|nr:hypothetical protein [Deinococcus soli (ex Cha et al. 2016)]MDR6218887.1 hypothetical protein [Deinococcus soli (ex Cha et al. 2016)]MDR6328684.1 hypothetical protein [Deinococcus soli (ex Cha et al. 2016)]MDR6751829.1 hypothetical protein [Deinococcus soli (ex Cha et al. 2016)]
MKPFLLFLALSGVAAALSPASPYSAALDVPQSVHAGPVPISVSFTNRTATDVTLALPRDARQSCVAAPHVRILQVGTREVVYPPAVTDRMCTMDMVHTVVRAGASVPLNRAVTLPTGQYLIEAWVPGVGGAAVRAPYRIVRVN